MENADSRYIDCSESLLKTMSIVKERAVIGKKSDTERTEMTAKLQHCISRREVLRETINYMVKLYKNMEQYTIDRRETSMKLLQDAIEKAGMIVPDASVNGLQLSINGKNARVVNKDGQDINKREGGAYRSALGVLLKYALVHFQPNACQVMFLDESFSTMSDTTADTMREVINVLKDEILIVGIEQRNYLYDGIEREVYQAEKGEDGVTIIKKVG